MDTILENAVQSVQIGVEDYKSDDPRRILSAIRNVTAGILLLFKEKLRELSPIDSDESLIKQKIKPTIDTLNEVKFIGSGKKTVDVIQIIERFKDLSIKIDDKRLRKIINSRNDIEHYCTKQPSNKLRELLAESFIIIRDFVTNHLGYEPSQLLSHETWAVLLDVEEVSSKEYKLCQNEIAKVEWISDTLSCASTDISCPKCHSELIKPLITSSKDSRLIDYSCCSCGEKFEYGEIIEHILSDFFEWESYLAAKESGEYPLVECFECGSEAFVVEEGMCMLCEATIQYSECSVCHTALTVEEQVFDGLCGYHHHLMTKDD